MATERPPPPPTFTFTVSPSLSSFNVPMKTYLATHNQHESSIATGAIVFDPQNRILLIQRAAHDSMPNLWETPGGAVDSTDTTILHGVARELFEEASLKLTSVTQKIGHDQIFFSRGGLRIVKFSFEVEVEATDAVRLDPNEHQRYLWASEEECRVGKVRDEDRGGCLVDVKFTTPAQKGYVMEALRVRREREEGRGSGS